MKKTTKAKPKTKDPKPVLTAEELTVEQRDDLLVELSTSPYWAAIIAYYAGRKSYVESGLKTIDPFQQPTEVARNQGILQGLDDLEAMVEVIKRNRADVEIGSDK